MTHSLPQTNQSLFLTDGGLETDLVFNQGIELPHFSSIVLVGSPKGEAALLRYYERYLDLAAEAATGFILESPTWRASRDWAEPLGYDPAGLARANARAIELMQMLGARRDGTDHQIVISGCIGPRGDGYRIDTRMSTDEARRYHTFQAEVFKGAGADMIGAITMAYPEEAAGIALAAGDQGLPVAISFTTETDGRLPGGETLSEAIHHVDEATHGAPAYYMLNCAHPDHFSGSLQDAPWVRRIRGVRANASRLSHAELDQAEALDAGDPAEFGELYAALRRRFPHLTVLGGCCGTDHRHIDAVRRACC